MLMPSAERVKLPWSVQVGGFTIFQNKDLGNILPLWIKYTEDVRADADVGNCLKHERSSTLASMCVHSRSYESHLAAHGRSLMPSALPMPRISCVLLTKSFRNACRHGIHLEIVTLPMQGSNHGLLRCEVLSIFIHLETLLPDSAFSNCDKV